MIIEVVGIYEHNKGALLMLEAIRERLSQAFPRVRVAVSTTISPRYRREHRLLGVLRDGGGGESRLRNRLPNFLLQRKGLTKSSAVDVMLDASGFGYGDFWGLEKLEKRLLGQVAGQHRRGKVAIMLPQALGPFERPGMADAFSRAVREMDLMFVRDAVSWSHVERIVGAQPHVARAPDFTNLLHPPLSDDHVAYRGRSFVVPNGKMVAGERQAHRETYLRFLASAVEAIGSSGRQVNFLIHEGASDVAIAQEANALLASPVEIVDPASVLQTKAVIAAADLIVSSRFHGLVSALASGVPALACGWSHKYAELMNDYDAADMNVSLEDEPSWPRAFCTLLDGASSPSFRNRLAKAAETQKKASDRMWQRTIDVIREKT